jgi:hypothetical protein
LTRISRQSKVKPMLAKFEVDGSMYRLRTNLRLTLLDAKGINRTKADLFRSRKPFHNQIESH